MRINFNCLNRFITLVALCLFIFQIASAQNPVASPQSAQKVETPKSQEQSNVAATEREAREFFDSYAEDLRFARRAAIADRYDPRGYFRLGNGNKTFVTFEDNKKRYLTRWTGPKSFQWKDLSIEVLSPAAVLVVGLFDWQSATGEIQTFSYTGLLIKQSGKWRIRVEDESSMPVKSFAQERKAIPVSNETLERYVGQYQLAPNFIVTITLENGNLMAQATGQPKNEVFAESETKFFLKTIDAQITFVEDAQGRATGMILYQGGRAAAAQKIK